MKRSREAAVAAALSLCAVSFACAGSHSDMTGGQGGTEETGGSGGVGGSTGGMGGGGGLVGNRDAAMSGGGSDGGVNRDGGSNRDSGANPDVASSGGDCTAAMPNSLFCKPTGKMPATLKETGLFPAAPDFSKHAASLLEYVPDPPLWSDGMEKQRFVLLPPGKKVDNSDPAKWVFPVGTIFIKTFFDDSGPGGTSRPIETRFIRRAGDETSLIEYDYYLYRWNAAGTDATLLVDDMNGNAMMSTDVPITIKHMVDGKPFTVNGGAAFQHTLPSRQMCGDCHTTNGMVTQTFIGFDELRLNSKRTSAATKTQLQEFAAAGLFTMPIPAMPATITDATKDNGRLLRIKRFVFGNCVHCHNGGKVVDLHPDVFVEKTVNKPTEAQSVKPPAGWLRVVPRSPQTSVLYVQAQRTMLPPPVGDSRLRAMPPDGVTIAEQTSLVDLAAWINSLP